MNSIPFSERRLYPVLFMIVLAGILTFVLALFYHLSKERVEIHAQAKFQIDLLSLFKGEIPELIKTELKDLPPAKLDSIYQKYITPKNLGDDTDDKYYEFALADTTRGLIFPISVMGLWSTIELLAAVQPDFSNFIGIRILRQGETPGLGSRITEEWFLSQLEGKKLLSKGKYIQLKIIPENEKANQTEARQITGATSSSRAVILGIGQKLQVIHRQHFEDAKGKSKI